MPAVADAVTAAVEEAALSSEQRKRLPESAFAIPERRAYPIHDEGHARAALSRVAQHGSADEKSKVRAAVKRRYPKLVQEANVQEALGGLIGRQRRNRRGRYADVPGVGDDAPLSRARQIGAQMDVELAAARREGLEFDQPGAPGVFSRRESDKPPRSERKRARVNAELTAANLRAEFEDATRGAPDADELRALGHFGRGQGVTEDELVGAGVPMSAVERLVRKGIVVKDGARYRRARVSEAVAAVLEGDAKGKPRGKGRKGRDRRGKFADLPTLATGKRSAPEATAASGKGESGGEFSGGSGPTTVAETSEEVRVAGVRDAVAEVLEAEGPKRKLANKPGKTNWVEKAGGLPQYIRRIAEHVKGKNPGWKDGRVIAVAVNAVKRMCASGDVNFPGKQNVNAGSRAEACAAVASWEAKKKGGKVAEAAWLDVDEDPRVLSEAEHRAVIALVREPLPPEGDRWADLVEEATRA